MFRENSDMAWERHGQQCPYFAVITDEKYKTKELSESALAEFFQSGERYIEALLEIVRERLDSNFQPIRALDFGCGVGRLMIPLAKTGADVVGVDVSDAMLNEGRKNCLSSKVMDKVELVKSDDRLSKVSGRFNFVVSLLVFQHIPPRRGRAVLKAILDRLDTDGVGVLHFTFHRKAPMIKVRRVVSWMRKYVPFAHNIANLIQQKPFGTPLMQWNNYNLNDIFLTLRENGCDHSYIRYRGYSGHLGVILFFQKKAFPDIGSNV